MLLLLEGMCMGAGSCCPFALQRPSNFTVAYWQLRLKLFGSFLAFERAHSVPAGMQAVYLLYQLKQQAASHSSAALSMCPLTAASLRKERASTCGHL